MPDEVLRIVPFAAFHDGSGFLVDRYATAIAPSLKLVEPKAADLRSEAQLSCSGFRRASRATSTCRTSNEEVATVHAIEGGMFSSTTPSLASRFAANLKSARYNIVHIASHGQFGADRSQTFVLAIDGHLTMDKLGARHQIRPAA